MSIHAPSHVTPTLVADQVYEILENGILTGRLAAGSPLRVQELAAMVGTSVMPVREAIRRLEEAGLATRIPHKGAVVKTFTVAELIHIYDVRTTLEVDATRKGTPNVTASDIQHMKTMLGHMQKAAGEDRIADALDLDEEILRTLYKASGNPVLVSVIDTLWLQCRPFKAIGVTEALDNHDITPWTPQPALFEAVKAGDTVTAAAITADSLASARRRLVLRLEPH
ncbi:MULTISPECIES: GntR family transcriptional regulator [Arthrobacter]|uniref:GntR family transcriptional regulator n=1 Tax=Arthrobacter terricola TaxID=2547396 RepID=A0A4R5K7S5_9MICC|nr:MULTISPECIES: GntR family transcriptional regulator [Arthrobacter]MBT8163561.1 GntR family transcriptional regulator [Arthrobacter sp. GN70]TDF88843.1 GntR family transcriptional regulator [Arthrobacter terricola]